MPYAGSLPVHDADSHLMEWPGWLRAHADLDVRSLIPMLDLHGMEDVSTTAVGAPEARDPTAAEVLARKNWDALGAFDRAARTRALDLLGFRSQLVFSTYSHLPLMNVPQGGGIAELDLLDRAVRAHNRGVVEFCHDDPRLLPVGWISLDEPARAITAAHDAVRDGCAAIEVASYPIGPRSLTHLDVEPLFALLEEARRPLVFHVGGGGRLANPVFANDGRRRDQTAGHAPLLPALTFMGIPAPVEMAVAALVLDGVLERHPALMVGVIEQGATWVPGFMRRLDLAVDEFGDSSKTGLSLRPSEYVQRQVRFTPFHYEDVEWLITQTSPDLYMFSTDYPHDEGSDRPLEWFLPHFGGRHDGSLTRFLYGNFEDLMGEGLPVDLRVQHGHGDLVDA